MLMTLIKLCAYFALVAVVYFIVPKKQKWWVLLAGNLLFYVQYSSNILLFILFTAVTSWGCGLLIEKKNEQYKEKIRQETDKEAKKALKVKLTKEKRRILTGVLLINLGIWIIMKYSGFLAESLNQIMSIFGNREGLPVLSFMMPLGMSYYTLVAAGYCIDIYRGKYPAEKNVLKMITFLSFFLQMLQGPFSRYDELSKTLFAPHNFSFERLYNGSMRMLWGVFKKCLVADKLSVCVNFIYGNYQELNGAYIFIAMVLFGIELYADFSGYMDIMIGAGEIMGIRLAENFKQPFFSGSIEEFWRRWHITLGAWFKNYLFYPVSMSKWAQNLGVKSRRLLGNRTGRQLPSYIALVLVWSATGLWHGASSHYLYWGLMQMVVILFSMQMAVVYDKLHQVTGISADAAWWKGFQMVRTFLLFAFMEIMSEAQTAAEALAMYGKLFSRWDLSLFTGFDTLFPQIGIIDIAVMLAGVIGIFVVDICREKQISVKCILLKIPVFPRYILYLMLLYMTVVLSTRGGAGGGFMYANF